MNEAELPPEQGDMVPIALPTSANRHLRRTKVAKKYRPNGRERREPIYVVADDGDAYSILHPTKGWRHYSERRLAAAGMTNAKRWGNLPWWSGVSAMEKRVANG